MSHNLRHMSSDPVTDTVTLQVNQTEITCLDTGGTGPLALCLHGFPDTAHTWRHLMPELAAAGYRAVAPFLRGYAPSAIPADGRYQTAALALDANALHEALGGDERAVIIGHDWGAPATYGAANAEPDRWSKVVGMAVPPGPAMGISFLTNLDQLKRSWYMFFFQHGLAEPVVAHEQMAFIEMIWRDWSPGYEASFDVEQVRAAIGAPEHLAAALGYYRATLGDGYKDPALDHIQAGTSTYPSQPTLYIHGRNDGCIGPEVAELAQSMAPDSPIRWEMIENAGHFAQLEQPATVNTLILEHLS
jgi:pimeloyl-ACP methyl ester carboxylesterase